MQKEALKFEILIYDGFDDLDAFGALEALRWGWASLSVEFKSLRKQEFVTAVSGVKIIPAGTFDLQEPPDVLIVPGGGWPDPHVGAWAEASEETSLKFFVSFTSTRANENLSSPRFALEVCCSAAPD